MDTIKNNASNIIEDNNFLFAAFENRLIIRISHIFDKYKIQLNKNIIKKNIEEYLINNLNDSNREIIEKYVKLLAKYEGIIFTYVDNKTSSDVIKKSTMSFIEKISSKNKSFINPSVSTNFIEYINSIIYVYDNKNLNAEVLNRINNDTKEILNEFNRNNYNFIIESINIIIKNIISNL